FTFFFPRSAHHRALHSFPTRRSSDLGKSDAFLTKLTADGKLEWVRTFGAAREDAANSVAVRGDSIVVVGNFDDKLDLGEYHHKADRKSTRLNSSHRTISYAVFC